jgi:hypothetical protein
VPAFVADEVERLARIAGMLGSAHEGERATAARMASAMLKARGLTWAEVINRGLGAGTCRQAHEGQTPPNDTESSTSDQGYSGSWGHQSGRDDWGARERRSRTPEHKGVPTRKWVHELLKQEGRLRSWDRQFLQCLQEMGKCTRTDLPLTTAQWQCLESIAEKIGWRPRGSGRRRRSRDAR